MFRQVDAVLSNLQKQIDATEGMLRTPLEQKASVGTVNGEIRAHVKSLSAEARAKFLRDANETGDSETLAAVLGGRLTCPVCRKRSVSTSRMSTTSAATRQQCSGWRR